MFYVGQKVVCVDNSKATNIIGHANGLIKGAIYTVSATGLVHHLDPNKLPAIKVAELDHVPFPLWQHRFRPIVDTKAEVSFTIGADPDSDKWDNRKVKVK